MTNVLFIGEQYIKDSSYIDENVDMKLLRATIIETQDVRVLPILGTGLYDELKNQVDTGTLTALNRTLLDSYISPAHKYWVLADGIYILEYKIMNKAIVKRSSENATNVDTAELDRLGDFFKDRAEFYSDKVRKYLIENNLSYPLYLNAGNGVDTVHPSGSNYTQGWNLGDDSDSCYNRKYS